MSNKHHMGCIFASINVCWVNKLAKTLTHSSSFLSAPELILPLLSFSSSQRSPQPSPEFLSLSEAAFSVTWKPPSPYMAEQEPSYP